MTEPKKIGITGLFEVKTTGRRHYIRLDPKTVETYGIKTGDTLKVEIQEVHRKPREEDN